MFSNLTVGVLLGLGFGAWIYSKAMHANGGQSKRALLVAAIGGFMAGLLIVTLLSIFSH
jgi:hypothetical protein